MADLKTEIRLTTITKEMKTLGKIRLARKRHKKNISPIKASIPAREIQGAVKFTKKDRR
jgi:hypothetical protein